MTRTQALSIFLAAALIVLGVLMRLVPHPANVTPLTAIALVSGFYFRGKWTILVPVGAMVLSDILIGWHSIVLFTWGSFAAAVVIGIVLRRCGLATRIIGGALAGSTLFYLVTNWAVWAFTPMYEKTVSGLMESYTMGLPFFRNMAVGDVLFTAVLVFGFEAVRAAMKRRVMERGTQ